MPLEGEVVGVITAENEEEAIGILHKNWPGIIQAEDIEEKGKYFISLSSLETIECVAEGNVCHVSCLKMHVEEIPLEEE